MSTSENVTKAVMDCEGIAFDGCHKVYVLMDKAQVEKMREYGYGSNDGETGDSCLITVDEMKRSEMLTLVKEWYRTSCALKFVQSIATVPEGENPNDGFTNLVPQGGYWQ